MNGTLATQTLTTLNAPASGLQAFVTNFDQYLFTQPMVTQYVGANLYAEALPSNQQMPAITYHIISNTHQHHLGGSSGYSTARVQVDSWSHNYADVLNITEALRQSLEGYRGWMGTTYVGGCLLDNEVSFFEEPGLGAGDQGIYHFAADYLISYVESRPCLTGTPTSPTYAASAPSSMFGSSMFAGAMFG